MSTTTLPPSRPTSGRRRARRYGHAAVAVAVALVAAACGSDDEQADETSNVADATDGPDGSTDEDFPVTIESALGTAVIDEEPERVVTIGWGADDIAVGLGTVPVGIEEDTWAGDEEGYRPWFREAVEEMGAELPTTFSVLPEIDMDAVIALEPDLILAPQSGITQDDFDILNDLAPTVAYPEKAWSTPWDTQVELVGAALGKNEEAAAMINDIEAQFTEAAAEHPEFEGVTFAYVYAAEPGQLHIYQQPDPRVEFIRRLGMEEVPELASMEVGEGQFTTDIGLEQADLLDDVDVLFSWFNDEANQEKIESQPLYAQIPAVERGSYVTTLDLPLAMATSLITPLSVPWALDRYTALISDAVEQLE